MNEQLKLWIEKSKYKEELETIIENETEIVDRFYQIVPFGTGGMRGLLGAGTNRMNIHTIRLVAEGLARQIELQGEVAKNRGVVIAYDTRAFSKDFAYATAGVLAMHGIQSYVFKESRPTPELSFAVRYLHAIAGVVITASHNPKQYNGFKVYGEDGAQLTPEFADEIVKHMAQVDDIFSIQSVSKEKLFSSNLCIEILEKLDDAYIQALMTLRQNGNVMKDLNIVYTPLHGAGLHPTKRGLAQFGFINVHIVEEQAIQDGSFPTVIYPNPEEEAAFEMAKTLGKKVHADILFATDPDADRLGVAVRLGNEYKLLTGNQLGALLLHYILSSKQACGTLPQNGVMLKTIVTSEMGAEIAESFGIETVNTLTGFKYIAEKIAEYEGTGEYKFLFGYEESYGYLAGDFVRDKDAVQIALLTAEMAAFYKEQGKTLLDALEDLYKQFGYYREELISLTFEGMEGQAKIRSIMENLRNDLPKRIEGIAVVKVEDYKTGNAILQDNKTEKLVLPQANVLKFILQDGSWICVRPSGTEPKCKFYIGVKKENAEASEKAISYLKDIVMQIVN